MQHNLNNNITKFEISRNSTPDYEDAIKILNLQSGATNLKSANDKELSHYERYSKSMKETQKYLIRSGLTLEELDTLSVIHVTGTKGKGTTCALTESILRHHGLKTGFYSSPHLIDLNERIRINGKPLPKNIFAKHFWQVYNNLENKKEHVDDMPVYFEFLTVLAFNVFVKEKIDVAVVEVGIGGEYDATNILRNVAVVGITPLGIDHIQYLGNSLERIAWHKAGIMKPNSKTFTVPQTPSVLSVFKQRSLEKKIPLTVIKTVPKIALPTTAHAPDQVYKLNVSLALALSKAWMAKELNSKLNMELTKVAISTCGWPGRYQILRRSNTTYYLDGAHTLESIQICVDWFKTQTKSSTSKKALIFNVTGDRNSEAFLSLLHQCNFQKVYFVANKSAVAKCYVYSKLTENDEIERCHSHHKYWSKLEKANVGKKADVQVSILMLEALEDCQRDQYEVLITGSLVFVGLALSILDPDLTS